MKRRRSSPAERVLAAVLTALLLLWITSVVAVVVNGRRDDARKSDAVVVLGAAQYAGRPSPVFKSRLDHAIHVWKSGLAPVLILTGGTGEGDTTTEAEVGRKYALSKGVPDSAILVENQGRTTSESLRTVAAMMSARDMHHAILVSDPFHMFRLRILARKFDLAAYTSPVTNSPISASRSRVWRYILSESIKAPLSFVLESM